MIENLFTSGLFMAIALGPLLFFLERRFPISKSNQFATHEVFETFFWDRAENLLGPLLKRLFSLGIGWIGFSSPIFYEPLTQFFQQIRLQHFAIYSIFLFVFLDFANWVIHLINHRTFLWNFHALHHSIKKLSWYSALKVHSIDSALGDFLIGVLASNLGAPAELFIALAVINNFSGLFYHSNIALNLGPFTRIINNPLVHHWHHSKECHFKGGQNFGSVLVIWDVIFNTFYLPHNLKTEIDYGLLSPENYPETFLGRIFYPFWIFPKKIKK